MTTLIIVVTSFIAGAVFVGLIWLAFSVPLTQTEEEAEQIKRAQYDTRSI